MRGEWRAFIFEGKQFKKGEDRREISRKLEISVADLRPWHRNGASTAHFRTSYPPQCETESFKALFQSSQSRWKRGGISRGCHRSRDSLAKRSGAGGGVEGGSMAAVRINELFVRRCDFIAQENITSEITARPSAEPRRRFYEGEKCDDEKNNGTTALATDETRHGAAEEQEQQSFQGESRLELQRRARKKRNGHRFLFVGLVARGYRNTRRINGLTFSDLTRVAPSLPLLLRLHPLLYARRGFSLCHGDSFICNFPFPCANVSICDRRTDHR